MTIQEFITTLNTWGQQQVPFLFYVDFEMEKPIAIKLTDIDAGRILYEINGVTNFNKKENKFLSFFKTKNKQIALEKNPVSFDEYQNKLSKVQYHLNYGDTFLCNFTTKTEVTLSHSLDQLFEQCSAKYKLFVRDQFLVFSPEIFIRIENGKIVSYPMKGTIDAAIPDAANIILNDVKEMAEHVTIVDLIRNDLSMVANEITVSRFRYIDELKTNQKKLLQVSSEIVGTLPDNYQEHLGDIITALLPAGSICGAPKKKTVEIIAQAEQGKRGYYTGVFGYFNGVRLDSGVMIRYIEQEGNKFYYRSGGGITTQSNPQTEYQEMIDKVYVPID